MLPSYSYSVLVRWMALVPGLALSPAEKVDLSVLSSLVDVIVWLHKNLLLGPSYHDA